MTGATKPSSGYGRNVVVSVLFVVLMSGMALANNVVIARIGGADARGLYGVVVAVVALGVPIISLGLGPASTYFVGRQKVADPMSILAMLALLAATPLCLTLAGGAWLLREALSPTALTTTLAAMVILPAAQYIEMARGNLLGRGSAFAFNLCQAGTGAAILALNAAFLHRGDEWVLWALLIAYWGIASLVFGHQALSIRRWALPGRKLGKEAIGYGARAAGTTLADAALLRVDYLIMTPILGLAAAGLYAIADQITHLMSWVGLVAGKMMLAESATDEDGTRARDNLGVAVRLIVVLVVLGAIIVAASFWWVVPAVFGDEFEPSYLGVLVLLPATLLKSLQSLVGTYLAGRGEQDPVVRAGATAVVFDIVAAAVSAWLWGWIGVAVARSVAHLLQFGLTYAAFRQHLRNAEAPPMRWVLSGDDVRRIWTKVRRR